MATVKSALSAPNLISVHRHIRFCSVPICSNRRKASCFSDPHQFPSLHAQLSTINPIQSTFSWRIGAYNTGEGDERIYTQSYAKNLPSRLNFDAVLLLAEILCIIPPTICSIACLVGSLLPTIPKQLQISPGNKLFLSQYVLLVISVIISSLIRWRQWQRLYHVNSRGASIDMIERIEKVEEDLKSSNTIVRMLSRQLEKLGIRFRVTRKTLKDPISEAATLAQKNSEVTRALAIQNDNLQNELREIQNVLIAMQEQQQKQLQLILAVAKAGRVIDEKRDPPAEENRTGDDSSPVTETPERESERAVGGSNDKL